MRPTFFSRYEWWYHLAMMPVLFAVGNHYFIGPEYFRDVKIFLIATALVFVLYWLSIITLTLAIRWIIAKFPDVKHTRKRLIVMLVVVGGMTVFLAAFDVWAYSITPGLHVRFSWEALWPILILGGFFDLFLCAALGLFYTFEKWKQNQTETEKLERLALQHQFNTLKGHVNPHFLFNSLNTLSSLISEDTENAEAFVEDLSKIYRYMLQAAKSDLVMLRSELDFLIVYTRSLKTRYGESLKIDFPTDYSGPDFQIPPLTLQTLVDNAVRYNRMSLSKPLEIKIGIITGSEIVVRNNLQRKTRILETHPSGLSDLIEKYRLASSKCVQVEETGKYFTVTLPLLKEKTLS
ncbi:sensor histidine kinase [Dyadobacter sediminis]|nr:histidine kinase [Dyadobacter sediminis]GGB86018.1 hypothetical protein GCM10011325_12060 [Dyadobacter sediminis]